MGDEILLQVLAHLRRAREPSQLLDDRVAQAAQLLAQPPEEGRRAVAEIGAVVLDTAVDLLRDRRQGAVDRPGELVQERRSLGLFVERCARPQASRDRGGDPPQRFRPEDAPARGVLDRRTDVVNALERKLGGDVDEGDRLRGQRLPPRDLVGIRGRNERLRELLAVRSGGRVRETPDERRELERV